MNPGRELDLLIATDVIGMKPQTMIGQFNQSLSVMTDEIRPYSTDIVAAWAVFEKLCERGMTFISFYPGHFGPDGKKKPPHWVCQCVAGSAESYESAPHAICLAALKVITTNKS